MADWGQVFDAQCEAEGLVVSPRKDIATESLDMNGSGSNANSDQKSVGGSFGGGSVGGAFGSKPIGSGKMVTSPPPQTTFGATSANRPPLGSGAAFSPSSSSTALDGRGAPIGSPEFDEDGPTGGNVISIGHRKPFARPNFQSSMNNINKFTRNTVISHETSTVKYGPSGGAFGSNSSRCGSLASKFETKLAVDENVKTTTSVTDSSLGGSFRSKDVCPASYGNGFGAKKMEVNDGRSSAVVGGGFGAKKSLETTKNEVFEGNQSDSKTSGFGSERQTSDEFKSSGSVGGSFGMRTPVPVSTPKFQFSSVSSGKTGGAFGASRPVQPQTEEEKPEQDLKKSSNSGGFMSSSNCGGFSDSRQNQEFRRNTSVGRDSGVPQNAVEPRQASTVGGGFRTSRQSSDTAGRFETQNASTIGRFEQSQKEAVKVGTESSSFGGRFSNHQQVVEPKRPTRFGGDFGSSENEEQCEVGNRSKLFGSSVRSYESTSQSSLGGGFGGTRSTLESHITKPGRDSSRGATTNRYPPSNPKGDFNNLRQEQSSQCVPSSNLMSGYNKAQNNRPFGRTDENYNQQFHSNSVTMNTNDEVDENSFGYTNRDYKGGFMSGGPNGRGDFQGGHRGGRGTGTGDFIPGQGQYNRMNTRGRGAHVDGMGRGMNDAQQFQNQSNYGYQGRTPFSQNNSGISNVHGPNQAMRPDPKFRYVASNKQHEADVHETVPPPADIALLNKYLHSEVKMMKDADVEVQRQDPKSPLYSLGSFQQLRLRSEVLEALNGLGFEYPTRIQETALPLLLMEPPSNLIAQAQSGTGKTAAFVLTMLCRIDVSLKCPQCICLAPTLELAKQIGEVVENMGKYIKDLKIHYAIKGGNMAIMRTHKLTEQIVIGTPGITRDYLMKYQCIDPSKIRCLVLDEADVMIYQQGFTDISTSIYNLIEESSSSVQSMLFSATYDSPVIEFATKLVKNAIVVMLKKEEQALPNIKQFYVECANRDSKYAAIVNLYSGLTVASSVIFCHTKASVMWLSENMKAKGHMVDVLHGEMTVVARADTIIRFKKGAFRVLITTNVFARGIDVPQVSVVINYDLPIKYDENSQPVIINNQTQPDCETYLHRIGRTGRFGKQGIAINFIDSPDTMNMIKILEDHFEMSINKMDPSNIRDLEAIESSA